MIHSDNLTTEPRLIAATPVSKQEEALERALRPKQLDEYVEQEKICGQLEIFIEAAKRRSEPLDHVLLFGPPGLGKKTSERLLLELQGKFAVAGASVVQGAEVRSSNSDIVNALQALGYNDKEADWAAKQLPGDVSVSDGIRQALKLLSKA